MASIVNLVFAALTLLGCCALQINAIQTGEMYKAAQTDCLKQYPLGHDELIAFNLFEHLDLPNPSKNLKCYSKCLNVYEGFIVDGKWNEAFTVKFIMQVIKSDEATAKAVFEKCDHHLDNPDLCETAFSLTLCLNALKKKA